MFPEFILMSIVQNHLQISTNDQISHAWLPASTSLKLGHSKEQLKSDTDE